MRFFYDTEFIENGRTIDLVSVGMVAEDGREYYAVSTDFDAAQANSWVRENVLSKLPNPESSVWKPRTQIRDELLKFVTTTASGKSTTPELWAWVGGYDHVVIAQLWGDMSSLPRSMPRFTHELKQLWEFCGRPRLPQAPEGQHDALVDARHNVRKFEACMEHFPLFGA